MTLDLTSIIQDKAIGVINNLMPTTATLVVPGAVTTAFNPATNEPEVRSANIETTINITPPVEYSDNRIDGTNVRRGDFMTVVSADVYDIDYDLQSTKLMYNDVEYAIISVKSYITGQQTAAYELQLRR